MEFKKEDKMTEWCSVYSAIMITVVFIGLAIHNKNSNQ